MTYPNYEHHRVFADITAERARQIAKWGVQHRADDTGGSHYEEMAELSKQVCQGAERSTPGGASWRLVLAEEVNEAFAETDPDALCAELTQVAAVCVAWLEDIRSRKSARADAAPSRPLTVGEAIIALVPGAEGAGVKP